MPDLTFRVEDAEAVPFAAAPLVSLKLRVENAKPEETIHSVALRAQIQIEATRRSYNAREKQLLGDLFGDPARWGQTLRPMLWTHASTVIPAFSGSTTTDLPVAATFDFNVAATKYFHGVSDGDIPLNLMFSGTVFYSSDERPLQVAPISWDKEARFKLPVKVWREMMELYYPNSAWLSLRKDTFDRLYEYKVRRGMQTWEEAVESLLSEVEEQVGR